MSQTRHHMIPARTWPLCLVVLAIIGAGALALVCGSSARAEAAPEAAPAMRLNPTGRTLVMPVPLRDGETTLGELAAHIDADDRISVRKSILLRLLEKHVKASVLTAIEALPEKGGQIDIASLKESGAELQFDQSEVALKLVSRADLKAPKKIDLGGFRQSLASSAQVPPAALSGYLNVTAGAEHLWANDQAEERTSTHLEFKSAVRAGGVVVENHAGYDGTLDAETCPQGAVCTYKHTSGFKRRSSRVIYDMPDKAIRLQAGDTATRQTGFQRVTDVLGVAIEKAPLTLQPDKAGRVTATHSFVVESPSEAEISVNGAVVRRIRLQPGNYDIDGLALTTGSNDVEITLIDATGERRTISRSTYFDRRLLAVGHSEWSLAAGVPSYYRNNERRYAMADQVASGYYRLGLSERMTGEASLQADKHVQMAGAGMLLASERGFFAARSALSLSEIGPGFAIGGTWDLINFGSAGGLLDGELGKRQTLRLAAEYRSDDFRQPGEFLTYASGLIFPTHDYWLKLDGSYSVPITSNVTATVSGRYQFGRDDAGRSLYGVRGDRYGADLTFSGALTETVSGSVAFGYSNESYLLQNVQDERDGEFRVLARAFVRLGRNTNLSANYDTLNNQSVVTGYQSHGQGIDRWETTVNAYANQGSGDASYGGSVAYYGNRGEVRVAHNAAVNDLSWDGIARGQQRTSVRAGASIAFADGRVAVGAPIHGGFAIVHPHESLAGKTIRVGSENNILAQADAWGPAVVPNLPAYAQTSLPTDVDDLPLGYSLGAGAFDVKAPYGAGYALEVGSGYSVSAYGTLVDERGKPVALLAGFAYPAGDKSREVTLFTNAAGRFAVEGMAPGKWHIEIADESRQLMYMLEIPDGTDGLVRVGELRPGRLIEAGAADVAGAQVAHAPAAPETSSWASTTVAAKPAPIATSSITTSSIVTSSIKTSSIGSGRSLQARASEQRRTAPATGAAPGLRGTR